MYLLVFTSEQWDSVQDNKKIKKRRKELRKPKACFNPIS